MTSIDSIVRALRQAVDHLHQALTRARRARDIAREGVAQAEALGADGVAQRFAGIADRTEDLERMLVAAVDRGEALIAQTETIRHGGGAVGGTGSGVAVPAHGRAVSTPAPAQPVNIGTPILAGPDTLDRILKTLPERPDDQGRTTGQLLHQDGRPVHDGRLLSFRDPSLLDDLDLPPRARQSNSMDSHVEAKAAKMMRDGKAPQHSTLVINKADGPCGWLRRQQGKRATGTTCDEWLTDILPADSSLTVRWRDGGGAQHSQVYRGTGRRIRR